MFEPRFATALTQRRFVGMLPLISGLTTAVTVTF